MAQDLDEKASRARDARRLLRTRHFGVLSTHSSQIPGYPFGSVVPYVLDRSGRPMILISSLALHTRNIEKDPRVSLTAWEEESSTDPQAGGRITWIGDASPVEAASLAAEQERYVRYLPSAEGHFAMHDFVLHRIDLKRARFIGGFGAIYWVEAGDMAAENPLAPHEKDVLQHVNEDHAEGLAECLRLQKGIEAARVVMVGVDPEGFDVLADGRRVRIEFERAAPTPDDVRREMIRAFRRPLANA